MKARLPQGYGKQSQQQLMQQVQQMQENMRLTPQKCREKNNSHHKTACLLCRCDRACSSMLHD